MTGIARHQAGAPASQGGRFRETTLSEASGSLAGTETGAPETGQDFLNHIAGSYDVIIRPADNVSQLRAALRNVRGEPDRNGIRQVMITWGNLPAATRKDNLAVHGPKDGRPIYVEIRGGHPDLVVESGYAVVTADDNSGHSITVKDGATATVIGRDGRKVSITAEHGSVVDFYSGEGTRGYQSVKDGALFTARGDLAHILIADNDYRAQLRAKDVAYAARLTAAGEDIPAYLRYLDS